MCRNGWWHARRHQRSCCRPRGKTANRVASASKVPSTPSTCSRMFSSWRAECATRTLSHRKRHKTPPWLLPRMRLPIIGGSERWDEIGVRRFGRLIDWLIDRWYSFISICIYSSSKLREAISLTQKVLQEAFDVVEINVGGESDDEDASNNKRTFKESKDPYLTRPLPYLIGSADFNRDRYIGLRLQTDEPAVVQDEDVILTAQLDDVLIRPEHSSAAGVRTQTLRSSSSTSSDFVDNQPTETRFVGLSLRLWVMRGLTYTIYLFLSQSFNQSINQSNEVKSWSNSRPCKSLVKSVRHWHMFDG